MEKQGGREEAGLQSVVKSACSARLPARVNERMENPTLPAHESCGSKRSHERHPVSSSFIKESEMNKVSSSSSWKLDLFYWSMTSQHLFWLHAFKFLWKLLQKLFSLVEPIIWHTQHKDNCGIKNKAQRQNLLCLPQQTSQTSSSGYRGGCRTSRSSSQPAGPLCVLDRLTPPPATQRATPHSPPPLHFLIEFPLLLRNRISSAPFFPSGRSLEGKSIVSVRKWGSYERMRSREAGVALCLGGSLGCDWTKEEEKNFFHINSEVF